MAMFVAPCSITTLTVAESPDEVPAVPEKVGSGVLEKEAFAGLTTATPDGAVVSMVKVVTALVVELPAASVWVTVTVKVPSASAETGVDQAVPVRVALNVWMVAASCLITTLTVNESPPAAPAVPEMVGVLEFDDDPLIGLTTDTPVGATESMVKLVMALVPTFDAESVCEAVTV